MSITAPSKTATEAAQELDLVGAMMNFEDGMLEEDETVALFQQLVSAGTVWSLPDRYVRLASTLIAYDLVTA